MSLPIRTTLEDVRALCAFLRTKPTGTTREEAAAILDSKLIDGRKGMKEQEQGQKVSDICRTHGISDATFYNWKSKYAGMSVDELKRLKELEQENARLKKIVANQSLEIDIIKDLLKKF